MTGIGSGVVLGDMTSAKVVKTENQSWINRY